MFRHRCQERLPVLSERAFPSALASWAIQLLAQARLIFERTRAALAQGKAQGAQLGNICNPRHAAALGRAVQSSKADSFAANVMPVVETIKASGVTSLAGIARALNARGVRSARGSEWHVSAVANLLVRTNR
jgi:DNA invertase Pin-like site-specific DNA recombinase